MKKLTLAIATLSMIISTNTGAAETTLETSNQEHAVPSLTQDSDELYNWREKEGVVGHTKISGEMVSDCAMATSYSKKHLRNHYKHKINCKK